MKSDIFGRVSPIKYFKISLLNNRMKCQMWGSNITEWQIYLHQICEYRDIKCENNKYQNFHGMSG